MGTKTKREIKLTLLDDIQAYFITDQERSEYQVLESGTGFLNEVGNLENTAPLDDTFETLDTLENSLNFVAPKVAYEKDESIKKMASDVKKKLAQKTVREELREVHYDEAPELANLENTLVLNAEILRLELEKSKKTEKKAKTSRLGKNIMIGLYVGLALFSFVLPYLVEYVF